MGDVGACLYQLFENKDLSTWVTVDELRDRMGVCSCIIDKIMEKGNLESTVNVFIGD